MIDKIWLRDGGENLFFGELWGTDTSGAAVWLVWRARAEDIVAYAADAPRLFPDSHSRKKATT